jgi:molybdopterin converting factor small subunit
LQLEDGATLADMFRDLSKTYGSMFDRQVRDQTTGQLVPFLILVNGRSYRSIVDMQTPLHDADEVTILVPFDGG